MSSSGSITRWLHRLPQGDDEAAERLFDRYFPRLVRLARRRMQNQSRRVADEEDVAISAFRSFLDRAGNAGFPEIRDRGELWRLLVVITARKAQRQGESDRRIKRGGGKVRGDSVWQRAGEEGQSSGLDGVAGELSPEVALLDQENLAGMMDQLNDQVLVKVAHWRLEGYRVGEIARMLGCAPRTVERKLALIREIWTEGAA